MPRDKAPRAKDAPEKTSVKEPKFIGGVVKFEDLVHLKLEALPRIAFAGRSNVGKSSLLNALTGKRVARVSAEPGKTREMNFFRWGVTRDPRDEAYLVDLPGYGYARVAVELRKQWGSEITRWLNEDQDMALVVALVDGRHGFLANDVELVEFLVVHRLPFVVAFTKMDKHKSANQRRSAERELSGVASKLGVDRYLFVSAEDKAIGLHTLEATLRETVAHWRAARE